MVLSRTERFWPSLSRCCCVPVLVVTLAIVSLASHGVHALDSGIDLLTSLRSNYSRYTGISVTHGRTADHIAYHFSGEEHTARNLSLPTDMCRHAADAIRKSNEFTLMATIRQEESNVGTIVAFSDNESKNRYLELQSSGRKNEIRFHYSALAPNGQIIFRTETFPYRLADQNWHKVALSVSGSEIRLLVDCDPLHSRVTHFVPDRNFSASTMKLFVGENHQGQYPLKGDIEDIRIVTGPNGHLTQCPLVSASCPTCGEFFSMKSRVDACEENFNALTSKNIEQDIQIQKLKDIINDLLENGGFTKPCTMGDGVERPDGDKWSNGPCQNCTCTRGRVQCVNETCPVLSCKNPVRVEGQCCMVCLQECFFDNRTFEHLEKETLNCSDCTCIDSIMNCVPQTCETLTCPNQTQTTGKCCPVCEGDDFCAKGHACDTNAKCINLNIKYKCDCLMGFQGNGSHCTDIDECAQQGDTNGNHCHQNTRCVNQAGSYTCECLPGFRRVDAFNCEDIDECVSGQHACPASAICRNTNGNYTCLCRPGYEPSGVNGTCEPVCSQTCMNGGHCSAPGVCTCTRHFVGASCERDLDECATGAHRCRPNEACENTLNGYYCNCRAGYARSGQAGECQDIDECALQTHTCQLPALCVNTDGHFVCECPAEEPGCERGCHYSDGVYNDGHRFSPPNDPCRVCTCRRGVMTCEQRPCNCTLYRSGRERDVCCSQCDPNESCRHQELPHVEFRSGEKWIYRCQTCECLYGEVDCWQLTCPALTCDNPLPLAPGECCPRCTNDPCDTGAGNATDATAETQNGGGVDELPCMYRDRKYESGREFHDATEPCTTCSCKNGTLRCNFDTDCNVNDDGPRSASHRPHPQGRRHHSAGRPVDAGHGDTAPQTSAAAARRGTGSDGEDVAASSSAVPSFDLSVASLLHSSASSSNINTQGVNATKPGASIDVATTIATATTSQPAVDLPSDFGSSSTLQRYDHNHRHTSSIPGGGSSSSIVTSKPLLTANRRRGRG